LGVQQSTGFKANFPNVHVGETKATPLSEHLSEILIQHKTC
jgi:hypothetical protein